VTVAMNVWYTAMHSPLAAFSSPTKLKHAAKQK